MQLVSYAAGLQKYPNDTALLQKVKNLSAAREQTMESLMATNPGLALRIHFPANLWTSLPKEIQNQIEHEVNVTGKLKVLDAEQINHATGKFTSSHYVYQLTDSQGNQINLHFKDSGPYDKGGATIKVSGIQLENTLATGDAALNVTTITDSATTAATYKKTAVILINFSDNRTQPWQPADVKAAVFGSTAPSANSFYQEQSFGQVGLTGDASADGDVFGWFALGISSTGCDYNSWETTANGAAAGAGANLSAYSNFIYVFPFVSACGFDGLGEMPGSHSWINGQGTNSGVISHELGHNFGLNHANSLSCYDSDGNRVTLSNNCTSTEYGDDFDVMGNASDEHHMNAFHKGELGYLSPANSVDVSATGTYTFTIAPLETGSSGLQVVRIPYVSNPNLNVIDSYYYIEYRQPVGYDSTSYFSTVPNNTQGVLIHDDPDYTAGAVESNLLDASPSTDWSDVALTAGNTFTDVLRGFSVTTTSVSPTGATIQVGIQPPPCVHNNPSMTLTPVSQWGYAGDTLEYAANIVNNDTLSCAAQNFTIVGTMPVGLNQPTNNLHVSLNPGGSTTYFIDINSSSTTSAGFYTFSQKVTNDNLSSFSASATANYNVNPPPDTTPPTAAITAPAGAAFVSGTINITGSSTDNIGVTASELYIDGGLVTTSSSASISYSWDTVSLSDGSHTLMLKAYDAAGNVGTTSITVTSSNGNDNIAPIVTISSPVNNSTLGTKVSITASATDNVKVTKMEIYIDAKLTSSGSSGSISYSWNTNKLAKGSHTIMVKAYDPVGNVGSSTITVKK